MHTIEDRATGMVLHHNSDWSGDVVIQWKVNDVKTSRKVDEARVNGEDLVAGRAGATNTKIPMAVLVRATALAVEDYMTSEFIAAAEQIGIPRIK